MFWTILVIILDGVLVYYFPGYFNSLSIFYPMLTVSLISILYSYYPIRKYYRICFLLGIIYDLLYSTIFLYNALIFLLLAKINNKIYHSLKDNLFIKIVLTILNIIIYDTIGFILIKLSNYNSIVFNDLVYKISHSMIVNILFVFVYFFIFKKVFSQHRM